MYGISTWLYLVSYTAKFSSGKTSWLRAKLSFMKTFYGSMDILSIDKALGSSLNK